MRTLGAFIDFLTRNLLRVVIIGAICFVLLGFALQTCESGSDDLPRKVEKTTYLVKTDSRLYYTDSYEWQGETLILHNFWVKEGKRWRYYKRDIPMTEKAYGKLEVIRR